MHYKTPRRELYDNIKLDLKEIGLWEIIWFRMGYRLLTGVNVRIIYGLLVYDAV